MTAQPENQQSAYHRGHVAGVAGVDDDVREAMRVYAAHDLGLADHLARDRADREVRRAIPKAVMGQLVAAGIQIADHNVLDLGAGLGGMSEELVISGARVTAVEPGAAWADLTRRRVARHRGQFTLMEAFGEDIPVPDRSFDLIVSLQVLEHVRDPDKVLQEVWRLLKPGGRFYLACENYLAFYEGHYRVPWLPLLPKSLGALYLRALGRSPVFLLEAVTYTTYPAILAQCRRLGFIRRRDEEMVSLLRSKEGSKWKILRAIASVTGDAGPLFLDRMRHTFTYGIYEMFRKPLA